MMEAGLYCADCVKAMREFPDGYFDLAIVDPPYGDGISGGGYSDSEAGSIGTKR